jgi:hypothetical protein
MRSPATVTKPLHCYCRLYDRDGITRLVGTRAAGGLVLIGDFHGGRRAAARALAAAQEFGAKLAETEALMQLAAVAAHDASPRWTDAQRGYTRALERSTALEARPLIAHCQLGLGAVSARMRSSAKACGQLGVAATMYRDMRMDEWARRATHVLASLA